MRSAEGFSNCIVPRLSIMMMPSTTVSNTALKRSLDLLEVVVAIGAPTKR